MKFSPSKPVLIFLLLTALLIISFSGIFIKLSGAPGNVTAFYRMFIGSIIVFVPFLISIKKTKPEPSGKAIWLSIFGGIIFGVDMILWTTGVEIAGATNPTLMANTAPVWVGLGAMIFFREKLRAGFWFGLAISLAGVILVMTDNTGKPVEFNTGTILGLSAAIFYGSFFLISQHTRKFINTMQYFFISTFSASLTALAGVLIFRQPLLDYSLVSWIYFLLMGLVGQVIGWLILNYLQGKLPASLISPTLLGQPVITAFLAVIILGETLTITDIAGGIIVLLGVFIIHKTRRK